MTSFEKVILEVIWVLSYGTVNFLTIAIILKNLDWSISIGLTLLDDGSRDFGCPITEVVIMLAVTGVNNLNMSILVNMCYFWSCWFGSVWNRDSRWVDRDIPFVFGLGRARPSRFWGSLVSSCISFLSHPQL